MKILDCTLRDGGYNNNWLFGKNNIEFIIGKLIDSGVDIIEIGYLKDKNQSDDYAFFSNQLSIQSVIGTKTNQDFAIMIDHKEYNESFLSKCPKNVIIRYAFHKKDLNASLSNIDRLVGLGFRVFVQPMVSNSYSKDDFLYLINRINLINPSAFYLVDSFGSFSQVEFRTMIDLLIDHLNLQVAVGFHSHDNRGLAIANGILFIEKFAPTRENVIIDSSVTGMGRGAGNLKTELLIDYLINNKNSNYNIYPILDIIDDFINKYYPKKNWGVNLNRFLSGRKNLHPDYAEFFDDLGLLKHQRVDSIMSKIDENYKSSFDIDYATQLYKNFFVNENEFNEMPKLMNQSVVLIAPGPNSILFDYNSSENLLLLDKATNISVNHKPQNFNPKYIFISKMKRLTNVSSNIELVITDDLSIDTPRITVSRKQIMNSIFGVEDNAGLMAIKLSILAGANLVYLIGFDGYFENRNNTIIDLYPISHSSKRINELNRQMIEGISYFRRFIDIIFLTPSTYNVLD
jgi:4-hydroxy 2-oxovalerate aldolase